MSGPCDPINASCLDALPLSSLEAEETPAAEATGTGEAYFTSAYEPAECSIFSTSDPSVSEGMLAYYRTRAPSAIASPNLPSFNQDLSLADWRDRLPAEITPYLQGLYQLEAQFQVPVSFRIVQVQLSTGENVPQFLFYRTGDEPAASAPRAGGPGTNATTGPQMPTTIGLTVALFGGSLAIIAFDRLLLQSLVDHNLMPPEARIPAMFTSVMTAHWALHRAGLVQATPMEALRAAPTFFGFQILARLLLDKMGMPANSFATDLTALTLAAMPFVLARQAPALAEALEATAAGRGFQLAGLSASATTLTVGTLFARLLGWLGIIDLGARAGTWGLGKGYAAFSAGSYTQNDRLWTLIRTSQDIFNRENAGCEAEDLCLLVSAFGMLITASNALNSTLSNRYEVWYNGRVNQIRDELVAGSDDFGGQLHQSIVGIIAQNTHPAAPGDKSPNPQWTTDWEGVQRDLRGFYQREENAENIENGYDIVDDATAPLTTSGIAELIEVVDSKGNILDAEEFRAHFHRYAMLQRIDRARQLEQRAVALGVAEDVNGVRVFRLPEDPSQITPEQDAFLKGEGLRLTMEGMFLQMLEEVTAI